MIQFDPENHIYTLNGVKLPSVTQILHAEGFIDTTWFTEYGRERGRYVHDIIHWYLTDELDDESIDPVLQPYFDAWLKFEADSGFRSEVVEKPFASETYRFAGTPDHIGCLNGHNVILDVKTGQLQPWVSLQLAAYEILVKHPSLERFSLHLTDDGKYRLTKHTDRQDRGIFLAALACYWWKRNNGRK
jgi:hypothetical protein